jgi:hypothetical protein
MNFTDKLDLSTTLTEMEQLILQKNLLEKDNWVNNYYLIILIII